MTLPNTGPVYSPSGGAIIPQNGSVGMPLNPPPTTSATPSPLTIKDIYGSVPTADAGIDSSLGIYKGIADGPVDEQAIRDATMKRLQAEIDATNQVYTEKLRQAHIVGESNLGSNAAISARRGLLGSDFGNAQNQKVATDNAGVYSGIDAEKAAAVAGITNKGLEFARQEIADKNAAKQQGASNYIAFLGESEKRRTARTTDAAKRAIAAGIDLSTLSTADVKAIADSYQISPDALLAMYVDTRNAQAKINTDLKVSQADLALKEAQSRKEGLVSVPYGGSLYDTKTQELIGGLDAGSKDLVSQAIQEGRLDASQITRYGIPFIVSTLEDNPGYDFAGAHTDYQRGITDSQTVTRDAAGNLITYETKPQGGGAPGIQSPTNTDGTIPQPKANAAAVAQSTKKLAAITAAHTKLQGDLAAISALADKVNARGVPRIDAFINGLTNEYSNNPDLVQFKHLVTSARGDYAVINSGGSSSPDQGDQERAAGAIPSNGNSAVYNALLATVNGEAERQIKAQQDVIKQFSTNTSGGTQQPPSFKLPNGTIVHLQADGTYQ